jgi:hypothetical protein
MFLSNIIIKVTLFNIGFGGAVFADGQAGEAQLNTNGDINIVNFTGEKNPKTLMLSKAILKTNNHIISKDKAIKTLKESVDYALTSDFQQDISKYGSKDTLNNFKEALDNAIAILSKDEKITKASDYDETLTKLERAAGMI